MSLSEGGERMSQATNSETSIGGHPPAVLVDLDGTLALRRGRSPYEWDKVSMDAANEPVIAVIQALADAGYAIVVVSGRDAVCRDDSVHWLQSALGRPFYLHMRERGDNRRDEVIKREIWETRIKHQHDVKMALDDRDRCVALWRSLGIPTFQVAEGEF